MPDSMLLFIKYFETFSNGFMYMKEQFIFTTN